MSYFLHEGYSESARVFFNNLSTDDKMSFIRNHQQKEENICEGDIDSLLDVILTRVQHRRQIREKISSGLISQVISECQALYPSLFSSHRRFYFDLLAQQFVEMCRCLIDMKNSDQTAGPIIYSSKLAQIIQFGQVIQNEYSLIADKDEQDGIKIKNVFCLLLELNCLSKQDLAAFKSPSSSYLLNYDRRLELADKCLKTLLLYLKEKPVSGLEIFSRNSVLLIDEMKGTGFLSPLLLSIEEDILKDPS